MVGRLRSLKHAFTVDVEDWFDGIPLDVRTKSSQSGRLEVGLNAVLEILAEHAIRGTFFVLGPIARRYPSLMRQIVSAGHEIGCHGWSHDLLYRMNYSQMLQETDRATSTISDITGHPVLAYRAAYFSVTAESLWALGVLASLGYRYDSSIFPVRNWRYGLPDFGSVPQRLCTTEGPIYEFPISIRQFLGWSVPVSGGAYFRLYPYWLTRANFEAAEKAHCPVVFYLHPWELDQDHPRVDFYWKARITHYANLGSTKWKLRRLVREFCFAPLGEVLGHELDRDSP